MRKTLLLLSVVLSLALADGALAAVHTITDPLFGTIGSFDDWGFPQSGGRDATNFSPINGFGPVSFIQHVVTTQADGITQDPPYNAYGDTMNPDGTPALTPYFPNANMDGAVNLFLFGYSGPAGSTFANYQVDHDGDVNIPKAGMTFGKYNQFLYHDTTGKNSDTVYNTFIDFEPFPMSDARGWCLFKAYPVSAGEPEAGQVQFDFGFAVTMPGVSGEMLQLVPGFQMRSYGTLVIDFTLPTPGGNVPIHYVGNAAPNNTNPALGRTRSYPFGVPSPDFYGHVSFAGGGVIPLGVWLDPKGVLGPGNTATRYSTLVSSQLGLPPDPKVDGYIRADGAIWHSNSFGGYPFLLRADGRRSVDYLDTAFYGSLDHDITQFTVTAKAKVGQSIPISLQIKNDGTVANGSTLATVVAMQGGVQVCKQSKIVSAIPLGKTTTVSIGSFTPKTAGTITWTATISDSDPVLETATATTAVVK